MRYVFHIGPHKTGTTYLQLCFEANRQALRERGILFPQLWAHAPGTPSQSGFSRRLVAGESGLLAQELESVLNADIHTVLVSAESLSVLEAAPLRELQSLTGRAQVEFVFYIRRWSDLLPSAFQEQVKQGSAKSLPEYAFGHIKHPNTSKLLNLALRTAPFAETFGADSIRYVCYSVLRDRQIDIFEHFARVFLGWSGAPPGSFKEPNSARSTEEVELLRTLNSIGSRHGIPPGSELRERFDRARDSLEVAPIYAAMGPYRRSLIFRDDWEPLAALHASLLDLVKPGLVAPHPANLLFRPRKAELPFIAADYLSEPSVAASIRKVFENLTRPVGDQVTEQAFTAGDR